jgi:hypothetical protein
VIHDARDFQPGKNYGVLIDVASEDDEEEDDDEDIEDKVPPTTVKLESLVSKEYDKDEAMATTMELSKAKEDAK